MSKFEGKFDCLNCKNCFNLNSVKVLNQEELATLNRNRLEVFFKKGEIIYKQGTPLTHLVVIHSGLGKIYIEGSKGKNLILSYTKHNDLNGGVGIFLDQRHHSTLMAISECQTCFIEINSFKSVFDSNPAFTEGFLRAHSHRVLHIYNQFSLLTQKNMEGRMAESILYLSDGFFNNGSIKNIPKQDFADLTAMSKESAIRVLKEFKDDGLIRVNNNTIDIIDRKALESIAAYG